VYHLDALLAASTIWGNVQLNVLPFHFVVVRPVAPSRRISIGSGFCAGLALVPDRLVSSYSKIKIPARCFLSSFFFRPIPSRKHPPFRSAVPCHPNPPTVLLKPFRSAFPTVEKLLPGQRYLLDVQAGWAEAAAKTRERARKRTFSLPFSRHGSAASSVSSESNRGSQSSRGSAHSTERASSVGSPRGSSSASSAPGDDQEKQPVLMFKRKIFLGADLDPPGTSDGDPVHMEARAFEYTQVRQRSGRQDIFSLGCVKASYPVPVKK
jgi:hypothetical protein